MGIFVSRLEKACGQQRTQRLWDEGKYRSCQKNERSDKNRENSYGEQQQGPNCNVTKPERREVREEEKKRWRSRDKGRRIEGKGRGRKV